MHAGMIIVGCYVTSVVEAVHAVPGVALFHRFDLMRALHPGMITAGADLNQAPAVPVEGPGGEALAMRWIERAASRRAWVILCMHDVEDSASPWGCAPATLERLADAALAAGFEVDTVAEGARRLGAVQGKQAA